LAAGYARCTIRPAAWGPAMQASGWRSQNEAMSLTVALAADMASVALTLILGVGCDPPLGSSARTSVSQNAIRNRNRMTVLEFPRPLLAAWERTVAPRLEAAVRSGSRFLSILELNQPRSFRKFE